MSSAQPQPGFRQDLSETARRWRLAVALAGIDIRLRYRGSWLGPFWLSLSTAVTVAALGVLYPALLGIPAAEYVPYLAVSLVLWNALAQLVADASGAFIGQEGVILSIRLPLSLHAARVVARNLLALAHQGAVLLPVFWLFGIALGTSAWTLLPALALWAVDGFFLVLALGAASARFRDIPPIVASIMQLAFFVTPVIWRADQLGARAHDLAPWLEANPLHALIAIMRAPLLSEPLPPTAWAVALAGSAALIAAAGAVFARLRPRLAQFL